MCNGGIWKEHVDRHDWGCSHPTTCTYRWFRHHMRHSAGTWHFPCTPCGRFWRHLWGGSTTLPRTALIPVCVRACYSHPECCRIPRYPTFRHISIFRRSRYGGLPNKEKKETQRKQRTDASDCVVKTHVRWYVTWTKVLCICPKLITPRNFYAPTISGMPLLASLQCSQTRTSIMAIVTRILPRISINANAALSAA